MTDQETKETKVGFEYSGLFTDPRFSEHDRSDTIRRLGRTAKERSEKITIHDGDPWGDHMVVFRDDAAKATTLVPAFATTSMGELGVFLSGWREGTRVSPFSGVVMVPSNITGVEVVEMPVRPRYRIAETDRFIRFIRGENGDLKFILGRHGATHPLPIDLYASPMNRVRVEVEWILERMGALDVDVEGSPFDYGGTAE